MPQFGNLQVPAGVFAPAWKAHVWTVKNTFHLEMQARLLSAAEDPGPSLRSFILGVCSWGKYAGIAGRIYRHNAEVDIVNQFVEAIHCLQAGGGGAPVHALIRLNNLIQLGSPSFASKHLRFLDPEHCPVLDSLVADHCGYPMTPAGYGAYVAHCTQAIADLANDGVLNPAGRTPEGTWFAGDIDMAVFAYISGWVA